MPDVDAALGSELIRVLDEYEELVKSLGPINERSRRLQVLLSASETLEGLPLCDSLELNLRTLTSLFAESSDWVLRRFEISGGREAAVSYIDGLADKSLLQDHVIKPLLYDAFPILAKRTDQVGPLIDRHAIVHSQVEPVATVRNAVNAILESNVLLLVDGESSGFAIGASGFDKRNISEPENEPVLRGPAEGFIENLRTNTAMIRRRIRSPQLRLINVKLGRLSRTDVAIAYIKGVASDSLVAEVKRRVSRIDIDGIVDSAYVEDLIEDQPYSPFPKVLNTQRPDTVMAHLLEGRIAIFVDGTPYALVVPITFWGLMQSSEDYYSRFYISTFLRILRYGLALVALVGPALYVAIDTYHQEMLPGPLLLTIAATREGIPFPTVVEAIIMELMFEALREAGVRLPKVVGQAVSIVGALVIGQAAVQAGLVSSPMVIVVALTGIASFTFPRFNLGIAIRLLRFPMIVFAGTFGLYGIMIGLLFLLVHLASLRSFGVPYLAPVAPLSLGGLTNVLLSLPTWLRTTRPARVAPVNRRRKGDRIKPGPEPWEDGPNG